VFRSGIREDGLEIARTQAVTAGDGSTILSRDIVRPCHLFEVQFPMRMTVIVLGVLAALLIVSQLVMGVILAQGGASVGLMKSHQHTGYLAVVVILAYIGLSLTVILSNPQGRGNSRF
jgi:hypothetical protein